MNYTRADYEELYGDHWITRSSLRARLMVLLLIVGWIAALLLVTGCDGEAAQVTAQIEQEAHQKKVALMSMPCTWVAQCSRLMTDCPIEDRKCTNSSDQREETE